MAWPARKIGSSARAAAAGWPGLSVRTGFRSARHPSRPAGSLHIGGHPVQAGGREYSLAWPARKQVIMRLIQRAAIVVTAAVALLAPVAAMATAASASPAGSTARAVTAAIRVTATIPVGSFPAGVAVNPRTNTIYVANDSGTVSVIRGRTNTVRATIP